MLVVGEVLEAVDVADGREQEPERNDDTHRRKPGKGKVAKKSVSLGMRWPVERTNSWMSNFGQLRRNTDRFIHHRLDQIALAVALVITVKLVKWADRWSPTT